MTLGATYPIRLVCRLLGVPRSSVYYAVRAPIDEAVLKTALLDFVLPSVDSLALVLAEARLTIVRFVHSTKFAIANNLKYFRYHWLLPISLSLGETRYGAIAPSRYRSARQAR